MRPGAASVQLVAGSPVLVIAGAATIAELCSVLERADSALRWRSGGRLACAAVVVPAARAAVALVDLVGEVPRSEPIRDNRTHLGQRWVSTQQAAEALGISERMVRKRAVAGRLAGTKIGGRWLIDMKELSRHAAA